MSRRILSAALAAALLVSIASSMAAAQEVSRVFGPAMSPAEAKIRAELQKSSTAEFVETPLQVVVQYLQDLHGIQIQIDRLTLDTEGISQDSPVTFNVKNVSLRSLLSRMLHNLNLTWIVKDEVLLITTEGYAAKHPSRRIYDVSDLTGGNSAALLSRTLSQALAAPTDEKQSAAAGGGVYGKLEPPPNSGLQILAHQHLLIVRGSEPQHQQLSELLETLRGALAAAAPMESPPAPPPPPE
jgi:type II secretory pathway component GspD/PulD (secretin)